MIDFLGIGAQKAGTSWLMFNLRNHPQVWTPFMKELHYFDVKFLDTSARYRLDKMTKKVDSILAGANRKTSRIEYLQKIVQKDYCFTDDWYRHIFSRSPPGKLKGEFTPYYSCLPKKGIEYIRQLAPAVKLIYMIRDPVDRAKSSLRMILENGSTHPADQIVGDPSFQIRGDYRQNIPAWETVFDQSQILYIPFGKVKSHPEQIMREVEKFLGLPIFNNYPSLAQPKHVSSKQALDTAAVEMARAYSEPQYAFLQERFGEEFVANIK
jgi:hypothetical protein